MQEIRAEINALDREIVHLLGQRFNYVKAASRFKTGEADVRAPQRFHSMLEQRRQWAQQEGLNPDTIESLFRDLVNHFIEEELKRWQQENEHSPAK